MWVRSPGQEDPLEEGMATHPSLLAWRIPWTEEPGGLQSMGSQRVRHHLATKQEQQTVVLWPKSTSERNSEDSGVILALCPAEAIAKASCEKPGPERRAGALGRPCGVGWGGRQERGSGWGTRATVADSCQYMAEPLPYCKVISLQLKKKKKRAPPSSPCSRPSLSHCCSEGEFRVLSARSDTNPETLEQAVWALGRWLPCGPVNRPGCCPMLAAGPALLRSPGAGGPCQPQGLRTMAPQPVSEVTEGFLSPWCRRSGIQTLRRPHLLSPQLRPLGEVLSVEALLRELGPVHTRVLKPDPELLMGG